MNHYLPLSDKYRAIFDAKITTMAFTLCLYLLELEDQYYYVGQTNRIQKRFKDHATGTGAAWTIQHKPLCILITREITVANKREAAMYENWMTLHYMAKFGWENVRGGDYHFTDPFTIKPLLFPVYNCETNSIRYYINNCPYLFGPSDNMLVYVLELENQHYYINHTKRLGKALAKHFLGNNTRWTTLNKPLRILGVIHVSATEPYREIKQWLLAVYIKQYGRHRVTGGQEG